MNVFFAIAGVAVGIVLVIVALVRSNRADDEAPAGSHEDEKRKGFEYFGSKLVWNSLLVAVGVALVVWGFRNPQIRPTDVGSFGQRYWYVVLTLWGIVAALIALNARGAIAKTLQWVLAGVVAAMLVVFPLWNLATSPSAPARTTSVTHAAEWHRLDLAAGEESEGIEVPVGTRLAFDGDEGIVLRTVYADGSMCITPREACPKKHIVDSFFVNEATTSGKVAYTFK